MAKYRKLSRTSAQRKALLRNQVTNLLYKGKIITTEAKAKEVAKIEAIDQKMNVLIQSLNANTGTLQKVLNEL